MMSAAMVILAAMDGWTIGLFIASFILSFIQAAFWWQIDRRTRKMERQESELKETARKLVSAEISQQTAPLQTSFNLLSHQIAQINSRLDKGDGWFNTLLNQDHAQELKAISSLGDLKVWVMREAATKEEINDLSTRVDKLHELLTHGLIDRIERAAAKAEAASGRRGA